MNDEELIARIRALSKPLAPLAGAAAPILRRIDGVKAVLFDVYGTLLVSASGDVGTAAGDAGSEALFARIREEHARRRADGVEFPEVEIRDIWKAVRPELTREDDVALCAVEHECRTNPVWPMPGAAETLSALEARGFATGVVSNAQFYTPLVFHALLGRPPPKPAAWSYEHGEAKPSARLFRAALDALTGIEPRQVLYIGNEMAKDILPAAALGCRTALFAGDRRSCRPGSWQPPAVPPDAVITELAQIVTGILAP